MFEHVEADDCIELAEVRAEIFELAMRDAYSTGNGLGLGLPGARRLMDEFEIQSELSKGTTVVMKKWAPERV